MFEGRASSRICSLLLSTVTLRAAAIHRTDLSMISMFHVPVSLGSCFKLLSSTPTIGSRIDAIVSTCLRQRLTDCGRQQLRKRLYIPQGRMSLERKCRLWTGWRSWGGAGFSCSRRWLRSAARQTGGAQ